MNIEEIIQNKTQAMYEKLESDVNTYIDSTNKHHTITFKDKIILHKAYTDIEYAELAKLETLKQLLIEVDNLMNLLIESNFTIEQYKILLSKVIDLKQNLKQYDKSKI